MDKSWINKPRLSQEYRIGVKLFLDFAFGKSDAELVKCPCNRCSLAKFKSREDIEGDLMFSGFLSSYTSWVLHGENICVTENTTEIPTNGSVAQAELDSTANLFNDLFPNISTDMYGESGSFEQPMDTDIPSSSSEKFGKGTSFDELLADFNQELYTGCTKFTKLSFLLKLYHIKCMCGISDKGISMVLDLLKEIFTHARLPDSFNDMKKVVRKLGLTYESIHACPNDCMLYWEGDAARETCKVAEEYGRRRSARITARKKIPMSQSFGKDSQWLHLSPSKSNCVPSKIQSSKEGDVFPLRLIFSAT
ncbi:Cell division cycle protein-like protein [Cardamine amara subsp. amara]|uniref:Cell division cycle protein-like protein n=1 Tax=Cardamine amara subsp. amara TaxID=228776 RepID=A0ABD1C8A1_CARAN